MNATERVGAKKRKPPSEESLANEYERKRARYQTEKDDPEKVAKKVAQRKDYYQKNKEKIKSRYQKEERGGESCRAQQHEAEDAFADA